MLHTIKLFRSPLSSILRPFSAGIVLTIALSACGGGGESARDSGRISFVKQITASAPAVRLSADRKHAEAALSMDGSPAVLSTPAGVLDWAESHFPELFSQRTDTLQSVVYEGQSYYARIYRGSAGLRYLGITPDGRVFGLGDFTADRLQQFESVEFWSAQVCAATPAACVTNETTVVFRVVATGPDWGQEPNSAWHLASPVKVARNFRLYDVEIARDAASKPVRLSLHKYPNRSGTGYWTVEEYTAYRTSGLIDTKALSGSSSDLLFALKSAIDTVIQQQDRPTRFVVEFSGHGGPTIFFEGTLQMLDAQAFVHHVRNAIGNAVLVLDFSTNCDVGYFDFVANFYDKADYLVASDQLVGGFNPGDPQVWLKFAHDENLSQFFRFDNTNISAFQSMISARESMWSVAQSSIIASRLPQAVSVFKLSEFVPLMRALKAYPGFNPQAANLSFSGSLATYIYSTNNLVLISALERFRFLYASDRNLFSWETDERGFGLQNPASLQAFLRSMP